MDVNVFLLILYGDSWQSILPVGQHDLFELPFRMKTQEIFRTIHLVIFGGSAK